MTTQQHELVLTHAGGTLDLFGANTVDGAEFSLFATADGTDWGNPESVRRVLRSAIANGSLSTTERYDNRTITVRVMVEAADGPSMAAGERALMLAVGRRAELTWTPPANLAAPCVFVVVNSDLKFEFNDLRDHVQRVYVLTLEALPFVRSVEPVVIEALSAFVAAPVVLNDCSTTTGWSVPGGGGGTISASGGMVTVRFGYFPPAMRYVATVSLTGVTKPYLAIESTMPATVIVQATIGGASYGLSLAGEEGNWRFYSVPSGVGSLSQLVFSSPSTSPVPQVDFLTLAHSDVPAATAGRQSLRVIDTPGSAPADGSLVIQSRDSTDAGAGTALGKVIVYTGAQFDPRLSHGRSDAATVDGTALSGRQTTRTTHSFYKVASAFPADSYALWVQAKTTTPGPVTWTITLNASNPTTLVTLATIDTYQVSAPLVGTSYNLLSLGALDLPGLANAASATYALNIQITSSITTTVGEALVFGRTNGALTIVDTTDAARVWLNAPSLDATPAVVAGRGLEGANLPVSLRTALPSWDGSHMFTPDTTYLYVGTNAASDPMVTGEFRPAWHTHPVE